MGTPPPGALNARGVAMVDLSKANAISHKSSTPGDEIPEHDVAYIVLYDYLFTTLPHTCTSGPKYFSK